MNFTFDWLEQYFTILFVPRKHKINIYFFYRSLFSLFGKCIYIFVVYHNKSRGHLIIPYHEQAKFIQQSLKRRELKRRRSIWRPLKKYATRLPDVVVLLSLQVVVVPGKTFTSM